MSYQSLAGRDAVGASVHDQPVRGVAADGDEAGGRIVEQICRNLSETQMINAVTAGLMNIPAHNTSRGVDVMEARTFSMNSEIGPSADQPQKSGRTRLPLPLMLGAAAEGE